MEIWWAEWKRTCPGRITTSSIRWRCQENKKKKRRIRIENCQQKKQYPMMRPHNFILIFRLSSSAFGTYYDILHNKSLAVVVKTSICKLSKCVNQIPVKWYHILCWLTEPILRPATRFKINRTELTYWSLRYSRDLRTIEKVLIKSSNMEY